MMAIQQRLKSTYGTAAIPTSITRLHWQRRFRRTEPPVMRLPRGALPRSFPVASTRCPASNSRNTISLFSKDRHQLISIDAGTRPDFARGAYEALQAYAQGLPPLTTVFV